MRVCIVYWSSFLILDIDECPTANCQHKCIEKKIGYKCECNAGYQPHPVKTNLCIDIDECKNRPCSQICLNEQGSYKCKCSNNYSLLADKHSCKLDG